MNKTKIYILCLVLSLFALANSSRTLAYVSATPNYTIMSDSVGSTGDFGSSTNFSTQDTSGGGASGMSYSTNFNINSGYQQMDANYSVSISSSSPTVNLGSIDGFAGGAASTSATWTIITDNPAGYKLSINKDHLFNIDGGGTKKEFDDLVSNPSLAVPYYSWPAIVENTAKFGFSIETLGSGNTAYQRYLHSASSPYDCNSYGGSWTTLNCWDTIPSTTPVDILSRSSSTDQSGVLSVIKIKAEIGTPTAGSFMQTGQYQSGITATVTML